MKTSNSITERIARTLMRTRLGKEIVQQLAASPITDNNFFPSGMTDSYRTRYDYDRIKIQSECLRAWRINPLARRIVNLISQFVIGKDVSIGTGRFRDCCPTNEVSEQYANCTSEVLVGPQKTLRWSVPEGTRNQDGELIHDDIIVADALLSEVDSLPWLISTETKIVQGKDPLNEMDTNF